MADGDLSRYRAKRDFQATPEPAGSAAPPAGSRFVVQKHAATRLHYDFRLELGGVLKSWAVTRGPSLDPADRRLAVHVEDHPLDYGGFEGTIPQGQYGGGTVMLWDRGTWTPEGDGEAGYAAGRLKFTLHGARMRGLWTLVRMGGRAARGGRDNWLLIKDRDDEARPGESEALIGQAVTSVSSGRTMDEIAAGGAPRPSTASDAAERKAAIRRKAPGEAAAGRRRPGRAAAPAEGRPAELPVAELPAAELPAFVPPMLATLADRAPEGPDWLHEIKLDGYRIQGRVEDGAARLLTRKGLDWTDRFASIARAAAALPVRTALLDGEVVALQPSGVADFSLLQAILAGERSGPLTYVAFDLLHLDGADLTALPLERRKERLRQLLGAAGIESSGDERAENGPIRFGDHVDGAGPTVFAHACRIGVEGTVSKRRDAPYRAGRGRDWIKVKCLGRQPFVIGGFTPPATGAPGLGSLLLGYRREDRLVYAGRVGTGFTEAAGAALRRRLEGLRRDASPFASVPAEGRRGAVWVDPALVCDVEFSDWTADGRIRHGAFKGLRDDLDPASVEGDRDHPRRSDDRRAVPRSAPRPAPAAPTGGVALSNPDRVLYADQGITKRDLADYYAAVAERMLPHIAGRPLSLVRCPGGQGKACFVQRHAAETLPDGVRRVTVPEEGGPAAYLAIDDLPGLVGLVQLGVLEIHPWGARADDVERPDRLVFDLDPDEGLAWAAVVRAAEEVRDRLSELGLRSFVKTSGGKGLHVVVPVRPRLDWAAAKAFARAVAEAMARDAPDRYVATMTKRARRGRIYVDYLRNGRGATAVAPYSTRARPGAPVAAPVGWDELRRIGDAARFTVANLPRRLARLDADPAADPWAEMGDIRQSVTARALKRLGLGR